MRGPHDPQRPLVLLTQHGTVTYHLCVPCRRRVVAILEQNFQRESVRIPED